MSKYTYDIHTAYIDADDYGNRKLVPRGLWVTARSMAHAGRFLGMTAGQVAYLIQHQGVQGWYRTAGGMVVRIIKNWKP